MGDRLRILFIGLPGTPIFETGERIAEFHNLDYFTIERTPDEQESYFADKIESRRLDTGDYMTGSESQHGSRDVHSGEKDRKMDSVRIPEIELLDEEEISDIVDEDEGVCSTELPDERLLSWATHVVVLDADTKEAVKWFIGRRKCYSCGAVFHIQDKPPLVPGICDRCGTDLKKKPSDEPIAIQDAYKAWRRTFSSVQEKAQDIDFLRVRVDKAKDFEHIVVTVDRWIRSRTGLNAPSWSYKR